MTISGAIDFSLLPVQAPPHIIQRAIEEAIAPGKELDKFLTGSRVPRSRLPGEPARKPRVLQAFLRELVAEFHSALP